tara:strand:+ start:1041 stop:1187 length:147 start_codon:yes stop_codon:yes gene_type:complete
MDKNERMLRSERARNRRHENQRIVEERTLNFYQKLKREKIKKKKTNHH